MKIIELTRHPVDFKEYIKRTALDQDVSQLIDESCIVVDKDTKEVQFIYKQLDWDSSSVEDALERIRFYTNDRTGGLISTSRIFGFRPRDVKRNDFCATAALATEHPKEHQAVCNYGKKLASLYYQEAPEVSARHKDVTVHEVGEEWIIPHTPFTSGIINKNNQLKYHFDAGNFKDVYSVMVVFKKDIEGGYLSIPEYDVKIALRNNTAFMFDGQEIMHGVTPIKKLTPYSYRYSIVYYSLQQMWNCLPIDDELARIRKTKMEREQKRWERLKNPTT